LDSSSMESHSLLRGYGGGSNHSMTGQGGSDKTNDVPKVVGNPRRKSSLFRTQATKTPEELQEEAIDKKKRSLKINDTTSAVLVSIVIWLCLIENENFYQPDPDIGKTSNESTLWGNYLRAVIMFLTLIIEVTIFAHYRAQLKILKIKKMVPYNCSLCESGLMRYYIPEAFLCAICCPPYFDYTFEGEMLSGTYVYSYNALISVVTLFKAYLIVRLYTHYSRWTSKTAQKICKKYRVTADAKFALKAELKHRPYTILGLWMMIAMVILGLAIRTFEMPFEVKESAVESGAVKKTTMRFGYLPNAFWMTIITMTTVGYGDAYPSTHLGRCIGVVACLIGMLLVSLMVVSLTVRSEFSPEEEKAYIYLKKEQLKNRAINKAANAIKVAFKFRKLTRAKGPDMFVQRFIWFTKLRQLLTKFDNDDKVINAAQVNIDELLNDLRTKLANDVNKIKDTFANMNSMEERLLKISAFQDNLQAQLEDLEKVQLTIGDFLIKLYNSTSPLELAQTVDEKAQP